MEVVKEEEQVQGVAVWVGTLTLCSRYTWYRGQQHNRFSQYKQLLTLISLKKKMVSHFFLYHTSCIKQNKMVAVVVVILNWKVIL